jgi:diaminopimelate decarboxylase
MTTFFIDQNTNIINTDIANRIAQEYQTPTYIYDRNIFESKFKSLEKCLSGLDFLICFAVKANSNLTILNRMSRLGSGFDIVSGGELHRVLAAGGQADKTVFAGVGKTKDEIQLGLSRGIRFFNIESSQELELINTVANEMSCSAKISIRINPNIPVDTHPYLATGINESKFGVPLTDLEGMSDFIKSNSKLELVGISSHIGSQINDIGAYKMSLEQLMSTANYFNSKGANVSTVDLGGGLAISYSGQYEPINLDLYGAMIKSTLSGTNFSLIIEPGKFLVAECGVLLTKVLYKKKNGDKEFLILDCGMNDLMRPSLYDANHKMDVIGKENFGANNLYDIGGPVCESGCMMAAGRKLPEVQQGDLIAIRDAGAYGFTMASNYNTRPRPAEILTEEDGSFIVIRNRETIKQILSNEELESLQI